jgi:hypothetical protein
MIHPPICRDHLLAFGATWACTSHHHRLAGGRSQALEIQLSAHLHLPLPAGGSPVTRDSCCPSCLYTSGQAEKQSREGSKQPRPQRIILRIMQRYLFKIQTAGSTGFPIVNCTGD